MEEEYRLTESSIRQAVREALSFRAWSFGIDPTTSAWNQLIEEIVAGVIAKNEAAHN